PFVSTPPMPRPTTPRMFPRSSSPTRWSTWWNPREPIRAVPVDGRFIIDRTSHGNPRHHRTEPDRHTPRHDVPGEAQGPLNRRRRHRLRYSATFPAGAAADVASFSWRRAAHRL